MEGVVRFRVKLADGRVLVGPIQGRGGEIGNSTAHLSPRKRADIAQARIDALQRRAERGAAIGSVAFEPEPGCVALYPDWSLESRGEHIAVPLVGSTFRALP
jgi:hypothetical protein